MKYILILSIACLLATSCSKEDHDPYDVNDTEAVFNALIGKWEFSRIGKDSEFKDTIPMNKPEYRPGSYFEFHADGTCRNVLPYRNEDESSKFSVYRKEWDYGPVTYIDFSYVNPDGWSPGISLVPDVNYSGAWPFSFTDSTFVFKNSYLDQYGQTMKDDVYVEIRRIK